jgi:hypothetical protein
MATRGIKVKEGENLSPSNIAKVVEALENTPPITKKEACQMLNISYNTTRLSRIIDEYKERLEFVEKRKKAVKNQPIDNFDRQTIVQSYLSNESIASIADSVFRTPQVVKNILKQYNIPIRNRAYTYQDPVLLEDDAWAEDYTKGDLVFSARYNSPAYIDKLVEVNNSHGSVYRIWILGEHAQWAVQPYYELADLRKLQKELGIKIDELSKDEILQLIYDGLQKAKKLKKASND